MKIDIICPLYNASNDFDNLICGIFSQQNIEINKIIFPVTQSNDNTLELAKSVDKATVYSIKKSDFSHSLTREEAIYNYAESSVVVLITQDVILSDKFALYNLTKVIDDNIIHSFAKQITKSKGIEKYTREHNYPNDSYMMTKDDVSKYQLKTFFSSDACAAYNRNKFIELDGFDGKKFQVSEDMYYARKAILSGYSIMYCSDSVVTHSHNLKFRQLYKRYYDIGKFFAQNPEFKQYKSNDSGLRLAFYILKRAILRFDIPVLLRWFPDMLVRYVGKKNGERKYD